LQQPSIGELAVVAYVVNAPDGTPLGAIVLPEVAANLCFGGHHHNRLFICASASVYAIDVNTRGVEL
jgi:gluconolactonase